MTAACEFVFCITVTLVLQIVGLVISHRIVEYKNEAEERLRRILAVTQNKTVKLRSGLSYHFFLRSVVLYFTKRTEP